MNPTLAILVADHGPDHERGMAVRARPVLRAIISTVLVLVPTACSDSPIEVGPVTTVVIQPDSISLIVDETRQSHR